MAEWEGKSQANSLGYRIFIVILQKAGVQTAYFILYSVAMYYLLFSRRSTRIIKHFLRFRFGYSYWAAISAIYSTYYIFGQTLIDKIVLMGNLPHRFTFDFEGEENLRAIVKGGKGGILLSAHLGNWEAAGHLLQRLDTKINVVMYDGEHEKIKRYIERATGERNFQVIVIKNDMSHVYEIGEALQKNELICLHADRYMPGSKTISTQFLGDEALFPEGPFALATAFKVPVCVVFAFKESKTHYHLYSSERIEMLPEENKRAYLKRLFDTFIADLEVKVTRYPKQWFNYYSFWKQNN
ncbi:MAG: lipid A biosynthesis acyltransferase [Saprospiraceae bacterium]